MTNDDDRQVTPRSTADLTTMTDRLAEWAACSAEESPSLIERFAAMGYDVHGKSREEVAEVLRHPPTRPVAS
ncbi:hypothetical protein [Methylobacterium sp. JK268]